VKAAFQRAFDILTKNKNTLDKLAKRLLEKEVLDRKEIEEIVGVTKKSKTARKPLPKSVKTPEKKSSPRKEKILLDKLKIATSEAGPE